MDEDRFGDRLEASGGITASAVVGNPVLNVRLIGLGESLNNVFHAPWTVDFKLFPPSSDPGLEIRFSQITDVIRMEMGQKNAGQTGKGKSCKSAFRIVPDLRRPG